MPSDAEQLFNAVISNVPNDGTMYTETQLASAIAKYLPIFSLSADEVADVTKKLQVQLSIRMDQGAVVVEAEHKPWLSARKAKIEPFFWERYRKQLIIRDKWSPIVVNALDRVADDILDLAGDPHQERGFGRKGLVVGDVQSGKTATYTAIACKAADAGYRLIVLLTGTIESLRRQTQIRLDEGFIGRDSSQLLQKGKVGAVALVGVGLLDGRKHATSFTSRKQDFSKLIATQLGFSISNSKVPVLLVCKKNANILENLRSWLETMNAQHGSIDVPLLLLDDEADSASINTNADRENATRTNKEIRKLLKLFEKSAYIGVTATPFANVFIHPDTSDKMVGDDLFPSSFIYALEPPSNYMGPEKIFSEGVSGFLSPIQDAEDTLPLGHKIDHNVSDIPESLLYAIRCFFLAIAIRDLRGEGSTHRSMLINVSRFTGVQDRVRVTVDEEVRSTQRDLRLYGSYPSERARKDCARIEALYQTWSFEYASSGSTWDEIFSALNQAIAPVVVIAVNQRTGASALDYQANKESGLRVIAVGGNSLSRGLTLEGLTISYFYRASLMYDTLLQMGRWFGYRGSYTDLCRLFLSEDAESWFAHITEATLDLRAQLKKMQQLNLTPREFGLKVRAHPDSLIVTARNKMRTAQDFKHYISLSGKLLETVRLLPATSVVQANYAATEKFIGEFVSGPRLPSSRDWFTFSPVGKATVAKFLKTFWSDPMNFNLQLEPIAEFLEATQEQKLQHWDVSLVNIKEGKAEAVQFAGLRVGPVYRRITQSEETKSLLISGTKARVGSGGAEREGLPESDLEALKGLFPKGIPDREYRARRSRPLLLVYLVRGYEEREKDVEVPYRPADPPLIALGLSFPDFDDSSIAKQVAYKINVVEWKSRLSSLETDDDIEDGLEER